MVRCCYMQHFMSHTKQTTNLTCCVRNKQYMLLSNVPPFHGATEDELIEKIFEAKVTFTDPTWENVSSEAKALIRKLLTVGIVML